MAENFNFSTQVGQNWTIPAAYYQGMSQSPTAGSVAAYAGLVRELGGMASDYMANRASENKREASTDAALNMSRDLYGQAGFDTSALDKYLTPQPNENQSQYTARKEAVLKVLPVWVDLMKEKTKQAQYKASTGFSAGIGSLADQILGENNQISTDGLTPANENKSSNSAYRSYGANPELPLLPNNQAKETRYGFPVISAKEAGVDDYLKKNPNVAGMAWGGGENDTDPSSPRSIIVNPYNPYMSDPVKREGLLKIEAARHLMSQNKFLPDFEISPEQQQWRKGLGAYSTDDMAFKQSIISRLLVGDDVPGVTPEQQQAAINFRNTYFGGQ